MTTAATKIAVAVASLSMLVSFIMVKSSTDRLADLKATHKVELANARDYAFDKGVRAEKEDAYRNIAAFCMGKVKESEVDKCVDIMLSTANSKGLEMLAQRGYGGQVPMSQRYNTREEAIIALEKLGWMEDEGKHDGNDSLIWDSDYPRTMKLARSGEGWRWLVIIAPIKKETK